MRYNDEHESVPGHVRKGAFAIIVLILLCSGACTIGCEKVEPGWAAVKVNQFGGSKGVQAEPITTGIVWYFRPMHDIYQFPTFTQTANWTAVLDDEASKGNDSISFGSTEGAQMNTDISIAYHFRQEKVPDIFQRFRKDADFITHNYVKARITEHFNAVGSMMTSADIMGPGKMKFLGDVRSRVQKEMMEIGIVIENIGFYGDMRVDDKVKASISLVIQARQEAERTRQQVETAKAEADKSIQQARGRADSVKLEADAAAYSDRARAEALAYANEKIASSLTDKVMQIRAMEKWNGVLPTVMGSGSTPFITLPK